MSQEVVRQAIDVIVRNIGGVIYIARKQDVVQLNEVGASIWKHSDGTRSLEQIIDAITEEYDVDRREAEADVVEFVGELRSGGFLEFLEVAK